MKIRVMCNYFEVIAHDLSLADIGKTTRPLLALTSSCLPPEGSSKSVAIKKGIGITQTD